MTPFQVHMTAWSTALEQQYILMTLFCDGPDEHVRWLADARGIPTLVLVQSQLYVVCGYAKKLALGQCRMCGGHIGDVVCCMYHPHVPHLQHAVAAYLRVTGALPSRGVLINIRKPIAFNNAS